MLKVQTTTHVLYPPTRAKTAVPPDPTSYDAAATPAQRLPNASAAHTTLHSRYSGLSCNSGLWRLPHAPAYAPPSAVPADAPSDGHGGATDSAVQPHGARAGVRQPHSPGCNAYAADTSSASGSGTDACPTATASAGADCDGASESYGVCIVVFCLIIIKVLFFNCKIYRTLLRLRFVLLYWHSD